MTNEWTKEIETLRARVAALEAALQVEIEETNDGHTHWRAHDALSGGTAALDAAVAAAVAAERARIRAASLAIYNRSWDTYHPYVAAQTALTGMYGDIEAAIGGAP